MNRNVLKQNAPDKLYFETIKQESISENDEEIPRYNMISVKKQKTS
jgi:hypothetical protein